MKKGEIISVTEYAKVVKTGKTDSGSEAVWVKNLENGQEYGIEMEVADQYLSADTYDREEKLPLTQIVEILESVGDKVFTANFNKKPKDADVVKAISQLPVSDLQNKKKLAECFKGEERTLRGRMIAPEPKLGRSTVIDLDIDKVMKGDYDTRIRLIDHRSLNWLIVNKTKYIVK